MGKIDAQLEYQLHTWRTRERTEQAALAPEARVRISIRFTDNLEPIQRAGFAVESVIGNIAIGSAALADIERIAALDEVVKIESDKPTRPHLNDSVPEIHGDLVHAAPLSLDGTGVIVGVVDTGIDIFHGSFRKPDGSTRILSIWDQTLTAQAGESPPASFTKGVEFSAAQIAGALAHPDRDFRHQDSDGHGTHVAGIAAGDGSQSGNCHLADTYIGVALKADIIVVKTTFSNIDNILGVQYIFQRAAALHQPAVVNLSLGGDLGPHDGTSNEEFKLDTLIASALEAERVVVVAAGNEGEGIYHAFKHLGGNGSVTLSFVVAPDDRGDQFDLWYSGAARLAFTLTPPSGPAYQTVPAGTPGHLLTGGPAGGDRIFASSTLNDHSDPSDLDKEKHNINFRIIPAAPGGTITTGTWTFTLQETANVATDFDVWINSTKDRAVTIAAFLEADRDRTRTITIPGTANYVITVGAYNPSRHFFSQDYDLDEFSSRGPTADGRRKPDICAPGDGITAPATKERSHWYICDCCLDFYVHKSGTSMAAPHITGVAALMLQRNRNLTYVQVREHIKSSGRSPDPITGPTLPNNDWGTGRVDAEVACAGVPLAGGGGGGGGGGGSAHFRPPVPDGLMASEYAGIPSRLRALEQRFGKHPLWQLLAALVSTHFDEVSRLINTNRRVGATWQRLHGLSLMREALRHIDDPDVALIPVVVADRPLHAYIERWLAMLARYSSARLQTDIERYRALILALPGATLRDLEAMEGW